MKPKWWKEGVVYQIYPRSFQDANGDGIGDLQGIIRRLDYIKDLGADIIWLSPVYRSPNDDNGYDISNYQEIMSDFGTMNDFQQLLSEIHRRKMKLVMDLVVNHTSSEHAWFMQSASSKDNTYRDFYIWRPAKDGREPNNWASIFGGSAWQHHPETDEYYLHLFTKKQPDLNWENPSVRSEVQSMMTWWLDKGIDGFRMDVINMLSKEDFESVPETVPGPYQPAGGKYLNGPRIHEFLAELKTNTFGKYDVMTVGETPGVSPEEAISYAHKDSGPLDMVFQFEHMNVDMDPDNPPLPRQWKLSELKAILSRWQTKLQGKAWNSLYFNNHDQPRSVSRFANDKQYRSESAKMLATALFCQQGTPFIYQGEEIGMTNVAFSSIEQYRDVATISSYKGAIAAGYDPRLVLGLVHQRSRDNARTPMQWNDKESAGFSSVEPWIRVNPNYPKINVEKALQDPRSIWYYYQKLLKLRKTHIALIYGDYQLLLAESETIFAYLRQLNQERILVITNFTDQAVTCLLPDDVELSTGELLLTNYRVTNKPQKNSVELRAYEARIYKLGEPT